MTELKWRRCDDPLSMWYWLSSRRDRSPAWSISDRKLRLFACACGRKLWQTPRAVWEAAVEPGIWTVLDQVERWADDSACIVDHSYWIAEQDIAVLVHNACIIKQEFNKAWKADVMRDIVGLPYREEHPNAVPAREFLPYSGWITPTVSNIANAIYRERGTRCEVCNGAEAVAQHRAGEMRGAVCSVCQDSGRIEDGLFDLHGMALLADALEEAGCSEISCHYCAGTGTDGSTGDYGQYILPCYRCGGNDIKGAGSGRLPNPILVHLRSPGPHVRGCWAVDLVLGKE